ncbi:MAG: hypothetical protein BWY03_00349 [Parcubacteria group bacterium ADurb.Bin159]|nr:MAG: hypothetical protein BWY03_00349 [Parcubacteria group bacterium ADurb.Bin159]
MPSFINEDSLLKCLCLIEPFIQAKILLIFEI